MSILLLAAVFISGMDESGIHEPRFIDARHVNVKAHSRIFVAGYYLHIWPANAKFNELYQRLQKLDQCRVFQSETHQVSCLSPEKIVSIYRKHGEVFWSEAYFSEQTVANDSFAEQADTEAWLVSRLVTSNHRTEVWIIRDSLRRIHQNALADARQANWAITLNDVYAGSFVLEKERSSKRISIGGWAQENGTVIVTRVTETNTKN